MKFKEYEMPDGRKAVFEYDENGVGKITLEPMDMLIGKVAREPKWILCEERMPKPRESVLLAVNSKYGDWVGEGCYWETTEHHVIWKGYRWNATYWDDEIIAWMPLPQPYREEER